MAGDKDPPPLPQDPDRTPERNIFPNARPRSEEPRIDPRVPWTATEQRSAWKALDGHLKLSNSQLKSIDTGIGVVAQRLSRRVPDRIWKLARITLWLAILNLGVLLGRQIWLVSHGG